MKRAIVMIVIISLFILPTTARASSPDVAGGVNDEKIYEEVAFVSGQAVKFTGSYKISEKIKVNQKTVSCKYTLTSEDQSLKGKLDRTVNYEINYTKHNDQGQTIGQSVVKSYSETITLDKDKYTLQDFQYSRSDVIDNRPASDFYSGTLKARKTYALNKDEGQVIVEISGGNAGYDNFWGSTETQIIDYTLDGYRDIIKSAIKSRVGWQGTIKAIVSDSATKTLSYDDNQAKLSSFAGGNMRITQREVVAKYESDLPQMIPATAAVPSIPDQIKRKQAVTELSRQMLPRIERLIIPKFKDTEGHWAEEDINKLYSLDVFEGNSQFFLPDIPMTRLEFIRSVVKAANMRLTPQDQKKISTSKAKLEVSPFVDVKSTDPDYLYVKEALNKGMIGVSSQSRFMPSDPITRAQAITIMIRALGFESKAPTPGYTTAFADDSQIPAWSKDSIYVAREIGLVGGDNSNRINPDRVMTRAEASSIINKFLVFLQKDLQKDYRENIILYN